MTAHNSADLILYNANVITLEDANPRARWVALRGERIVGVDHIGDGGAFRGKQTKLVDCQEMTLIPGFNDAHMHLNALISTCLSIDCSPSGVSSIIDIQQQLRAEAREIPTGNWIRGSGYNEFALAEKRHPNRWDLDQAAPDHPVKLSHRTRHACVLNSLGLKLAGISRETPDPDNGIIDRDFSTGEPTGILYGMNAHLSKTVIPARSTGEMEAGLIQANRKLMASGITSIQDATITNGIDQWQQFQKFVISGRLKPRVTTMIGHDALHHVREAGLAARTGDERLRLGMVKIIIDEMRGPLNPPQEVLNEMVLSAHEAGFQVALHAVEENTTKAAIDAIAHAQQMMFKRDHRHRIEHCAECPPHLLGHLQQTGAIVVTQPAFLYYGGNRYLSQVTWHKLPWLYRMGSWVNQGITVAASSDGPVVGINPLIGIYAAVTRKSETGQVLCVAEAVSAQQALWSHTMGGAIASFEEHQKGSIATGKLADLVLLSHDPTSVSDEEIKGITVLKTIIGGDIVWEQG